MSDILEARDDTGDIVRYRKTEYGIEWSWRPDEWKPLDTQEIRDFTADELEVIIRLMRDEEPPGP